MVKSDWSIWAEGRGSSGSLTEPKASKTFSVNHLFPSHIDQGLSFHDLPLAIRSRADVHFIGKRCGSTSSSTRCPGPLVVLGRKAVDTMERPWRGVRGDDSIWPRRSGEVVAKRRGPRTHEVRSEVCTTSHSANGGRRETWHERRCQNGRRMGAITICKFLQSMRRFRVHELTAWNRVQNQVMVVAKM